MDRLLRYPEVSELLGVPIATLRDWRARGIGPQSGRIGGRVAYRESDVKAWVDEQFRAGQAR